MISKKVKTPIPCQALLDENTALKEEIQSLRMQLEEAEELRRAISEGDLDALVIPGQEGELIFTLDSADRAYRTLVETMTEGTATLAYDGTVLYCNRSFADILKTSPQVLMGKSINEFIAPASENIFKALLNQNIKAGELNLRTKADSLVPVYLSVTALQEEAESGWCLVATDLTEQKKREEIVASERLARSIIEHAAEIIIVCDEAGRIIRFSNAAPRLCECTLEFKKFEDIIDLRFSNEEGAGKKILPISAALKGDAIFGIEAIFKPKSRQSIYFLLNSGPLKNEAGEIIGCVLTLTDITERKQFEDKLHESEERYRVFFENSIDAILLTSPDGAIYAANPVACQIFGLTEEEIIRVGRNGIVDTSDPRLQPALGERARTGKSRGELNFKRKDGTIFPVDISTSIFKDRSDLPKTSMIIRDITTRKQVEEALHKSEEKYRLLFETMTEGFAVHEIITDEHGKPCDYRFLDVNSAFEKLIGVKRADLIGKRVLEVFPNTEPYWIDDYGRVALTGEPLNKESYFSELGRWYEVIAYRTAPKQFAVVFTDITRRKRAEETMVTAHRQLQSIIDNTPALVYALDWEERFIMANTALAKLLNSTPEQMIGKKRHEFMPRKDADWHESNDRQVFKAGKALDFEEYSELKDRSITWLTTKFPLHDTQENIYAVAGISADITERKHAEEALHRSKERFELLSDINRRLLASERPQDIIEDLCSDVMKFLDCDAFFNYLMDKDEGCLHLNAWAGISDETAKNIEQLDLGEAVCGCVANLGQRIIVENILEIPDPRTKLLTPLGITAYACHPLMDGKEILGTLSFGTRSRTQFSDEDISTMKAVADAVSIAITRFKTEEALLKSEEKYRQIVETSQEGIWLIDGNDQTIFVNQRLAEMLGYRVGEILGESPQKFMAPEFCLQANDRLHEHMQGIRHEIDYMLIRKDGSEFWCILSSTPLFDDKGEYSGSLAMLTDITERKNSEQKISRYNRVLSGINHVFQTIVKPETEEELGQLCLSAALEVTGGGIGFIGEVGADGIFRDVGISDTGWVQYLMDDKTGQRRAPGDNVFHGLYGKVIDSGKSFFTNDPQAHPDSIVLPSGHPHLKSFLGVPLIFNGKVTGMIAVANREGGYSLEQQEDLEALAVAVVQTLQRNKEEQERKRVQKILRRSEDQLSAVVQNVKSGIALVDETGKFVLVNPSFMQMFSLDSELDILNVNSQDWSQWEVYGEDENLLHVDDHPVRKAMMTGKSVESQLVAVRCPGAKELTWMLISAEVIAKEDGSVYRVICTYHDITERKKAEKEIFDINQRLTALMNALPVGVSFSYDPSCQAVSGNPALYAQFDTTSEDELSASSPDGNAPGRQIRYFLNGRQISDNELPLQRAVAENREILDMELEIELPSGRRWIAETSGTPIRDASGNAIGSVVVTLDITERKQLEEQIRRHAEELETVMNVAPVAIWIGYGPQCNSIVGNRMANEFYEAENGENVSANVTSVRRFFYKERELTADELPMQEAASKNINIRDVEFDVLLPSGRWRSLLGSASPLHDANGNVRGSVGTFIDITPRKQQEKALSLAYEDIQLKSEELHVQNEELQEAYLALSESEKQLATIFEASP